VDIDIDVTSSFEPKQIFPQSVLASMIQDDTLKKHPCGVYFQQIPIDQITNLAAIPYEEAEILGYFKFDFLHLTLLEKFTSKQQMRNLIAKNPNWDLLLDDNVVKKLFQISKHSALLARLRPRSVQDLADVIALLRPAKKHLVDAYEADKMKIRQQELYTKSTNYYFKRSHAISYALTIVLQLHLIEMGQL